MATYTGRIVHATLTPNTVDTITFDADYAFVEILNRDGNGEIYATIDTTTAPTVSGVSCDVLPAAIGSITLSAPGYGNPTSVQLISAAAVAYTVKGMLK
jgi:hypothetical protein